VIGAGGLGAPLLQYLTAAGVGTIGIFDFDQVDITNLQRQVLYKTGDAGKPKAETAGSVLQELNPNVNFNIHPEKITADNAVNLLQDYHIIADGSDNFLTRSILNIASLLLDIPLVYGSVYQYEGQLTVFNYVDESGNRGPEYGDVFPEVPDQDVIPNCAQAGVIGALPGIIGSAQAMEVIKIITGIGSVLSGRLLIADMLEMDFTTIEIPVPGKKERPDIDELKKKLVRLSEKADQNEKYDSSVNWITPSELKTLLEEKAGQFQLIDVRSPEEHQLSNIGGTLIPLEEIEKKRDAFSSGQKNGDLLRNRKPKRKGHPNPAK